ncbi:protein D2-like [Musca domestica]|uniref:Protein D2-like n=1 Tax=Musca domestica TaxID=7370 RepID=A0A1I8MG38_MUSDO|nr:protein D2-like [Musca domestica]XP_005182244.1 protein D2-like [Musca domestica]
MALEKVLFCGIVAMFVAINLAAANNEVESVFKDNEIIPDVIDAAPQQFLKVSYDNGLTVDKGIELTPTQVQKQPKVEWDAEDGVYYTLIMTDPDAPSRVEPKFREFRHWLVVNIPGNQIDQGEVLAAYIGSGPPKGTGLHRYVFLLYKQSGKLEFDEARVGNNSSQDRPKFKAAKFAEKYNLGSPIAGNFYQAQYDDYVPILHKQLSGQ